jgi:hypothetical protein
MLKNWTLSDFGNHSVSPYKAEFIIKLARYKDEANFYLNLGRTPLQSKSVSDGPIT